MAGPEPMTFEMGLDDFDLALLPTDARDLGTEEFRRAVTAYFAGEFAELGGTVGVDVRPDRLVVTWEPVGAETSLLARALDLLKRGDREGAVPVLRALIAVEPNNADAHYNLGMALSDLGQLDSAQLHLLKVLHVDPDNVNALVALGVALYRARDLSGARRRLDQAVARDPSNGYAHRNLAAVLANAGEHEGAIAHFREAYRLLPHDQASAFDLARALDEFGGDDDHAAADTVYKATIAIDPGSDVAERARQARSRIAQRHLRAASGGLRMDAVMYCLGALERFAQMRPEEVQAVGVEIALLGQRGLEVNRPEVTYTLRTIPGEFTGLQLMSLMYVAFKQIAPEQDIGFDLSEEYAAALQLHAAREHRS
jgi:tetratricopeptide (TPR) repeat protein